MIVTILDASHPHWGSELEHVGVALDASHNATLFPYHFLYVTLSNIGGYLAIFALDRKRVGVGFLFPRHSQSIASGRRRTYTLRFHSLLPGQPIDREAVVGACATGLNDAHIVFYDPLGPLSYFPTYQLVEAVNVGRPDAAEAAATRELQREVWGSPPEFLYPADLHSAEFAAGTSLVAWVDDRTAAFLFGFYKFDGGNLPLDWHTRFRGDFRLESQTLAVRPEYRGLRIAYLLKKTQADFASREGIGIINWTADPLQYPNAALNFGLLRAVAFDFAPDLYPFRNKLNRVHASRFNLTWLVGTQRVQQIPLTGARAGVVDVGRWPQIQRVNDGFRRTVFDATAKMIAIEIPNDWSSLQQSDLELAQTWRTVTDGLFKHYVGSDDGKYVVTGVGTQGEHRFLIAERATYGLWEQLAS